MAKKTKAQIAEHEAFLARLAALESSGDYEEVGSDIAGFWVCSEPNQGEPVFVRLLDRIVLPESAHESTLMAAEVLDGAPTICADKTKPEVLTTAKAGDVITFILSADLRKLEGGEGRAVIIYPAGMRSTPKGEMKAFRVIWSKEQGVGRPVFTQGGGSDGGALGAVDVSPRIAASGSNAV